MLNIWHSTAVHGRIHWELLHSKN